MSEVMERHARMAKARGAYAWQDRDEDVIASFAATDAHPHIVGVLRMAGGADDAQVGIYVDREQAQALIERLQAALAIAPL